MRRSLVGLLALSGLVLAPAPALAAKPAPPRDELGKKSSSVAPDKSLAGDITRKKASKKEEIPTLKYDQFRLQVELQVASKRHEQIEYLQRIIQLGADEKEMPTLLFRLAELYWEESKYYFFEANRKDDEIFAAKDKGDQATVQKATEEKKALLARSGKFQVEAIKRYRSIVSRYPKFERMDEVLYFLGHNLWEANKEQDALTIYKAMVIRYPKSKYIPDAWLAFGEYYFNNSGGKKAEVSKALASYKHAADFQNSSVYGFALYKEAWCYYNLGDFRQALDLFKAVIFYGDYASSVNKENKSALVREARKDYVLTYSHSGDPLAAEDDFKKVGGQDEWMKMFKGLAGLYYDDGKDKEAVLTYRRLIQLQPLSPDTPMYQARIVDAVMRVGNKRITVDQVRVLVKLIDQVKKSGAAKTDEEKKALASAEDLAERTMSNLAVNWHNEAKKTRDDTTFELANEVYADYLAIFPNSKKSYDLRFFWAELLNDNLQKYDKAAAQYTKVVQLDVQRLKNHEKPGKWLTNAAYDAVLAYDEVAKKFEQTEAQKTDAKRTLPIPEAKKKLLEACEGYLRYVPKGDKAVEIAYKVANIYYRYNHFDEAQKGFDDICSHHPENELAEYSCNLVLDTRNLEGDLQGVYDAAKKYLGNAALIKAHSKLAADLKTVLEQTSFKLVSQLEGKGAYASAAKRYLGYVDEFPKSNLSDTALFNASVDFYKGHRYEESIQARERLIRSFPGSKYVPDAIYANGEAAEAVGDFEVAAAAYEWYAHAYQKQAGLAAEPPGKPHRAKGHKRGRTKPEPAAAAVSSQSYDSAKAQIALFNAAVFREGLGEYKPALADRELYLALWPDSKDAESIFLSIAKLYEKQHQWNKAATQLEDYEKKYGRDPAKTLTAEGKLTKLYEKVGNRHEADKVRARLFAYYNKLGPSQRKRVEGVGLEEVAQAHLASVEPTFDEYLRVKFRFPPATFKKLLKDKASRLQDLQKRYTETVGFKAGGPAICALKRIGDAYAAFSDALNDVPLPKGLTQDQQDGIREGLQQQAVPLDAKAGEAYQTAVAKSRELSVYNDCAVQALAKLADKYAPDQFPKMTESVAVIRGLPEPKEGGGILTAVQPIPTVSPEEAAEAKQEQIAAPALAPRPRDVAQSEGASAPASPNASEAADDAPPSAPPSSDDAAASQQSAAPQPTQAQPKGDEPEDDLVP